MNPRVTTRHLLAALPLLVVASACSNGGSTEGDGVIVVSAQANPAGGWVIEFTNSTNCGVASESGEFDVAVDVNGSGVSLSRLGTAQITMGTLAGRQLTLDKGFFADEFSQLAGAGFDISVTFDEGFATFSGSSSTATQVEDENLDIVPCVVTTTVSGRRVACSTGPIEEFQFRFLQSNGTKIPGAGAEGFDNHSPLGNAKCVVRGTTLTGTVDGRTFRGTANFFGTLDDLGLPNTSLVLLDPSPEIRFSVVLAEPGQVARGTWSGVVEVSDPNTGLGSTLEVSGILEVTLTTSTPSVPDCIDVSPGSWVFQQFVGGAFFASNTETLSQGGCTLLLGDFGGTLTGSSWDATSSGGDTLSGAFSSPQSFAGQGIIDGIAVEITGAFVGGA